MTRPKAEMQNYHGDREPPTRWPVWRVFRWAAGALVVLTLAAALFGCASRPQQSPADDDGLWEIRNHYPLAEGVPAPSRDLFKIIAGPGCQDHGREVICPDRGTGWHFAAEFENDRLVATWQQRRV